MAAIGRPEDPAANLATAPTGLPVPNQGGIPHSQGAPQRTQIKPPIVNAPAGPPGPAPGPLPIFGFIDQAFAGKPAAPKASATAATASGAKPLPSTAEQVAAAAPVPRITEHKLVSTVSGMPDEHDLDALREGEAIATLDGEVYREPGGRLNMALNDVGKVKYEAARVALHKRAGWYPGLDDPVAPKLEVIPGLPVFNPFAPPDRAWIE